MRCGSDKSGGGEDATALHPTPLERRDRDSRGVVGRDKLDAQSTNSLAHSLAIVSESRAVCGMGGMGLLTFSPPWQRELRAPMRGWAPILGREGEGVLHSEGVAEL